MMRSARWLVIGLVTIASAHAIATYALAQKHAVEFEIQVPDDSKVKLDIHLKFDLDELPDEEVQMRPQKLGNVAEPTIYGDTSDTTPWGGTIYGVVDLTNNILQIDRADLELLDSGNYCPGPEEGNPDHECPELGDPLGKGEFPAELGYSLSDADVGGQSAGSFHIAVREGRGNIEGQSAITNGNEIDTWHWHSFTVDAENALDGTGAASDIVPFDVSRLQAPNNPAHNENHEPEPTDDTELQFTETQPRAAYLGEFNLTGQDATILIPLHVIGILADPAERKPAEYFRLHYEGQLFGAGTLGNELLDGDANNDGKVDGLDVNIVSANWTKGEDHTHLETLRETHEETHGRYQSFFDGDFSMDSMVGQPDFDILANNFGAMAGAGSGGATVVPEPTSMLLVVVAGLGLLFTRRRRVA